jgi:hypothetical protein
MALSTRSHAIASSLVDPSRERRDLGGQLGDGGDRPHTRRWWRLAERQRSSRSNGHSGRTAKGGLGAGTQIGAEFGCGLTQRVSHAVRDDLRAPLDGGQGPFDDCQVRVCEGGREDRQDLADVAVAALEDGVEPGDLGTYERLLRPLQHRAGRVEQVVQREAARLVEASQFLLHV